MAASTNLRRSANQAKLVGNPTPPDMAKISDGILSAASPAGFNLLNMRTDKTASDAAAAACRNYKDIEGLRRLQGDQISRTDFQPGCGWRYKPSNGLNPEINQAALGTAEGPSFGKPGSPDEVVGGTKWYWNLGDAERDITTKICQSASKCNQLNLLGRFTEVCGYCKTSGAVIPVQRNGQTFSARYTDQTLGCESANIVTASTGSCAEGFIGRMPFSSSRPGTFGTAGGRITMPSNGRGDLTEAFQVRRGAEGFVDLDALNNCMESPLSRDCVIVAARTAGCSDEGSLITALKGAGNGDYDNKLKANPVYTSYKSVAAPGITNATLKDGSVSLNVALDDFGGLMRNTQSQNQKLALSARDLCIRSGEFEGYDFCAEMGPTTIINNNNLVCAQQYWKNQGGTAEGKGYPNASWFGKPYQQVIDKVRILKKNLRFEGFVSAEATRANSAALLDFIGTQSGVQEPSLPRTENTLGAETVWFDYGVDFYAAHPPVILRCDLRLAKNKSILNGQIMPSFESGQECMTKYNFPHSDTKAFKTVFEIRSDTEKEMMFHMASDDGMMVSVNQNPFENTANAQNDQGLWRHQGPTGFTTKKYPVNTEKSGKTNTVVMQWFNGHGGSYCYPYILYPGLTNWTPIMNAEVYLTQEPLAPWLQYEVCTRPNNGAGNADGFFEKRFNGPTAKNYAERPFVSFDVATNSLAFQTSPQSRVGVPKGLPYVTFTGVSDWNTMATIHANAVRTYTILVRPEGVLSEGQGLPFFIHSNPTTFKVECDILRIGGQYKLAYGTNMFGNNCGSGNMPITPNEWNLVVLQYVGDENGLRKVTCNVESLARLRTPDGLRQFSAALRSGQSVSGSIVAGAYGANYYQNSGQLRIGRRGFRGDVAWLHGFRNFLDTEELLKKEVEQSWISRWPRGNLDSEPLPKMLGATIPEQNVYGNNGSVSCDMYCKGYNGGSWNGELPQDWNGAKCIRTPNNPNAGCFVNGQTVCTCQRTGTGWSSFRF